MAYDIKGKVVLVTGAATGIGAGVVKAFLQEGAKHVAVLDIVGEAGKAFVAELNAIYGAGKAKFFKCDVTNDEQLFNGFNVTLSEQGYIDVVVNNAAILNDSIHTYKKEIEINVTAVVTSTIKAIEIMRKDKGGKGGTVVNVSSIAGIIQVPELPIYHGTKSAVLQFSNCIGMEDNYKKTGVRVVTICFGATDTPLLHKQKAGTWDDDLWFATWLRDLTNAYKQKPESAVRGVMDSYKFGESGSTWLSFEDKPTIDITKNVKDGYHAMSTQMRV